jgi:dihydropteroate synthase
MLSTQLTQFLQFGMTPDIGFESTAPKNNALTFDEEVQRIDQFLTVPVIELLEQFSVISINTYRFETYQYVRSKLSQVDTCIWNDISGQYDDTQKFFQEFPKDHYVYCVNFAKSRSIGSGHLQYIQAETSITEFVNQFKKQLLEAILFFEGKSLGKRVIFDFCFGFAKTREQSLQLLKQLPQVMNIHRDKNWLVGISRKSFIRNPPDMELSKLENLKQVDLYQAMYLVWLKAQTKQKFIPRLHDAHDFFQFESFSNLL